MSIIFDAVTGRLSLDTTKFGGALQQAGTRFSTTMSSMASVARSTGARIAAFFGASGITGAIGLAIKTTANYGDRMLDLATRTGLAVEQMSALKFAADLNNTSIDAVALSINRMQRAFDDARTSNKELAKTFELLLGQDWQAIRDTHQLFLRLADALRVIDDDALKTASAMDIFGRSGTELFNLFEIGSEGIQQAADEAARFGRVISEDSAKAADEFNDNLDRIKANLLGISTVLGNQVIPKINDFFHSIGVGVPVTESLSDQIRNAKIEVQTLQNRLRFGMGEEELRQTQTAFVAAMERRIKLMKEFVEAGVQTRQVTGRELQEIITGRTPLGPRMREVFRRGPDENPDIVEDVINAADIEQARKELAGYEAELNRVTTIYRETGAAGKQAFQEPIVHLDELKEGVASFGQLAQFGFQLAIDAAKEFAIDTANAADEMDALAKRSQAILDGFENLRQTAFDLFSQGFSLDQIKAVFDQFGKGAAAVDQVRAQINAVAIAAQRLFDAGLSPDKIPAALQAMGFNAQFATQALAGLSSGMGRLQQQTSQIQTGFQQMARGILANINPIPKALRTIGDVFRSVFTGIQSFGTQVFTQFAQSWGQFFQVIDQLDAKAQSLLQADMLRAQLQLLQINLAALQASSAANPQSIADLQAQIAAMEAQIRAAGGSAGSAQSISAPLNVNIQTSGGEVAGMRVVQQVERQLKRRGVDLTRSRSLRLTTA